MDDCPYKIAILKKKEKFFTYRGDSGDEQKQNQIPNHFWLISFFRTKNSQKATQITEEITTN